MTIALATTGFPPVQTRFSLCQVLHNGSMVADEEEEEEKEDEKE